MCETRIVAITKCQERNDANDMRDLYKLAVKQIRDSTYRRGKDRRHKYKYVCTHFQDRRRVGERRSDPAYALSPQRKARGPGDSREREAWQWAKDNALTWTPRMQRRADDALRQIALRQLSQERPNYTGGQSSGRFASLT
jgi:hypothetical protein